MKTQFVTILLSLSLFLLSGCQSHFFKPTGSLLVSYSEDQAVPFILSTSDTLTGCAMGEAFSPFIMSFKNSEVNVDRFGIISNTLSGLCAEQKADEQKLRYLRANKSGMTATAEDALIAQARFRSLAAQRQYAGYRHMRSLLKSQNGSCPVFETDSDEFYFLMGLINGVDANRNDITSGRQQHIPAKTLGIIAEASQCLDAQKWWGLPYALQATSMLLAANTSKDSDPRALLKQASDIGMEQGVRLSLVYEAESYKNSRDSDGLKRIIQKFVASEDALKSDQYFQMLDAMAHEQMLNLSDQLWTEATGFRTPLGQFGKFWQKKPEKVPTMNMDDLI